MEERKSVEQGDAVGRQADAADQTGGCEKFNPPAGTGPNESIRKLLRELEGELAEMEPTEATKKFGDDLKEADKEYQSLGAVITKYREFYNKLDLRLAEARSWRQDIKQGCAEVDEDTRREIRRLRKDDYEEVEGQRLCDWLELRGELIKLGDCLSQARKEEEQAADDYKAFKEFEKNLTAKFADLAALWKQATGLIEEERFNAVCAVDAEFRDVYYNLGTVVTWKEAIAECNKKADELKSPDDVQAAKGQQGKGGQDAGGQDKEGQGEQDEKRLKRPLSPDDLKEKLTEYLRALILAKYQRFRTHNKVLRAEADNSRAKESLERFRKSRRAEFIQEAEDVEAAKSEQSGQPKQPGQPAPPTRYGQTPQGENA